MAQLRNLSKIKTLDIGARITVGHNRQIERIGEFEFVGRLYGNPVFYINSNPDLPKTLIAFATCGYRTTTTRNAMQDFARAFHTPAGISFAKGGFSAHVYGKTYEPEDDNPGEIHIQA